MAFGRKCAFNTVLIFTSFRLITGSGCEGRYDEELPDEAECEEEFSIAITLLRSLIRLENKGQVKKKSNFYTLYGACLRYYRSTQRTTFKRSDDVARALTALLGVTEGELEDGPRLPGYYRRYFNAVTRAASDKGRRVEREEIVFALLNNVDEGNTPDGYVNLLLNLTSEEPDQDIDEEVSADD